MAEPDPKAGGALATVKMEGTVTRVTGKLEAVASGSGLVFRYADPQNYWSITASVPYDTWNLSETVGGITNYVANTGSYSLHPKATTVEVRLNGSNIVVVIDGTVAQRLTINDLRQANGVGMVATASDRTRTRWTSLTATQ